MSDYTFKDNSKEVLSALEKAIENGLFGIGMAAEGHAKEILTDEVYSSKNPHLHDENYRLTGRLRNSITFALSGEETHTKAYSGDNGEIGGNYTGTAPNDSKKSVYIGTNVLYAEGIELGTHRKAGAVHFLQKATTNYKDEYKTILENSMKNAK